jgi:DNA-binding transcriptional LysR family regulator
MRITFRQLRAFVTTAQLSSFVNAASVLHITQAALSNAIKELEDTVGFRLLERTTRRVWLSEEGALFLPHALQALDAAQQLELRAAELRSHHQVVKIATSRLVGWSLMPRIYQNFHTAHPEIQLTPIDVHIDGISAAVAQGHVDLAISSHVQTAGPNLEATPLFTTRLCVVCSPFHPLAQRKRLRWREIIDEPLILVGNMPLLYLSRQLGPGYRFSRTRQVDDITSALSLVAARMGLCVLPWFVEPATRVHQLKMLEIGSPAIRREYALQIHARRADKPAVRQFARFLIAHFAREGARSVEPGSGH